MATAQPVILATLCTSFSLTKLITPTVQSQRPRRHSLSVGLSTKTDRSSVKVGILRHFLNIALALAPLALALAPPWANPSLNDVASSPSPNPSPAMG